MQFILSVHICIDFYGGNVTWWESLSVLIWSESHSSKSHLGIKLAPPPRPTPLDALLSSTQKEIVFCHKFICPHIDEQGVFEPKLNLVKQGHKNISNSKMLHL